MRRAGAGVLLPLLLLLVCALPARAQTGTGQLACPGIQFALKSTGVVTFSVGTTAVALPSVTLATSVMAVATFEQNPIRFRSDGTTPSSTVGTFWAKSTSTFQNPLVICGPNLSTWKGIQDSSASGSASATVETFGP